ncbi:toll-like receptor 22 [Synchiropus splendidus]|uniref:toll-like receptor 22 n=1 Tax=Synchiropus splendidus TaxID=270530 RepID=UPI00237E2439|nr:toll-like receptor 22 [Synchiropus splendidus]XP_053714926.1 toll-like receptor 22 [Synchiropus splendidus]XP_053714927.1 toll-like receptor 22 [Synchiropus splendidus]XP_053714928.1 toll-like receptor 22 [Synchiropus splendidus]XP_053714929.1 toll-like receptor 22 [Synchiropus splendidus]
MEQDCESRTKPLRSCSTSDRYSMNRGQTRPGTSTSRSQSFLLLLFSSLICTIDGFTLRSCHISNNVAICKALKLREAPRDIPSTVTGYDLSLNKLTKIEVVHFKNLTALRQLDMNRNIISQIEKGSFTDLTSLEKLNLNNNKLRQLADIFEGLHNLKELRLTSNSITTVSATAFKPLKNLAFLDLSFNQLQNVDKLQLIVQHLPYLQNLVMKKNNLAVFTTEKLTNKSVNFQYLDLSQNPLQVFRITADVFPNLTWLNLGGPQKKHRMAWEVRNQTFLRHVTTLDIGGLRMTVSDMEELRESFKTSLVTIRLNAMPGDLQAFINISCSIPTLTGLQIRRNQLTSISPHQFQSCTNITELDIAENKIQNIDENAFGSIQRSLSILTLSQNKIPSVPAAVRKLPNLSKLDLSHNKISSLQCHDFANLTKLRILSLHNNSISNLPTCTFSGLDSLQVLKLQSNKISTTNGAFKKIFPRLRQLRLDSNTLTGIKPKEFEGLVSLQNLSLHHNKIKDIKNGSFFGLTNLTDLLLQSNAIEEKELNSGAFNDLINVRRLDLRENHIKYKNHSAIPHPPFSRLSLLETLAIPAQSGHGKGGLPRNFLVGLTNLLEFYAKDDLLISLHDDMFQYTPRLELLDISSNELFDISPQLFSPISNLSSLYVSRTNLRSLDFFTDANLTKLVFLQGRNNQYSVIPKEVIESLPSLEYMDLQGNSFTCDCDNAWFLQWVKNNTQTQVPNGYSFVCNYPKNLKGMKLLDLDVSSCTVDIEFILYVVNTSIILLFLMVSFTYNFLRWQLSYAYHIFLAFLYDKKNKHRKASEEYDAFISYNVHDEEWVIREVLPKLEGEQGWKLCLHHRDFQPGKPIIDNITEAIYASRKTICVISQRYLESEWCSKELQVASYRLFDESKDVLILVFLEEIPAAQLSPYYRMRKLLKKRTYLSWPYAGEGAGLFWEKLRQALSRPTDNVCDEQLRLTVRDRLQV